MYSTFYGFTHWHCCLVGCWVYMHLIRIVSWRRLLCTVYSIDVHGLAFHPGVSFPLEWSVFIYSSLKRSGGVTLLHSRILLMFLNPYSELFTYISCDYLLQVASCLRASSRKYLLLPAFPSYGLMLNHISIHPFSRLRGSFSYHPTINWS